MKISCAFVLVTLTAVLTGCGGGSGESVTQAADSASAPKVFPGPELRFVVNYNLAQPPAIPTDTIQVSPAVRQRTIGTFDIAKVELLLFGHDKQELSAPNFQPKDNFQLRYVFRLPATFQPGLYPCGTGKYLSEVRVTDVTGFSLSKTFEICPGMPLEVKASAP